MHNQILYGEKITNEEFYDESSYHTTRINGRVERSDDPVFQANIIKEQQSVQERFEKEYWKQN